MYSIEATLKDLDGIDQWNALSKDLKSERNTILHNIDDEYGNTAITIGKWKLHKGTSYDGAWDGWYGPGGRGGRYDAGAVCAAASGRALRQLGLMPTNDKIFELRKGATIECDRFSRTACHPLLAPCLFDIEDDPCETNNLADREPEKLRYMLQELDKVNKTAIKPNNKPLDPRGDPKYWGHVITNFGDYENTNIQTR